MRSKLFVVVVALAFLYGCASTGGVKKVGYVGLTAAGQAIWLAQGIEPTLVCDRAGAPPAPACVMPDLHHTISLKFVEANKIGEKASDALFALPAEIKGPTPEILNFVSQIWDLLNEIRGLIPASAPQKKLASQLDELAAKK